MGQFNSKKRKSLVASPSASQVSDKTLTPDDVADIANELVEAQNHSFPLGLQLKLPHHEVEAIHSQYQNPQDRLLHVLIKFTKQAEPRPTWKVIVNGLRAPIVSLHALADKVEKSHSYQVEQPQRPELDTVTAVSSTALPEFKEPKNKARTKSQSKSNRGKLTVQCDRRNTAPCEMVRGSATSDGKFAYFTKRGSKSVYQYELSTGKWEELPSCPYQNSALVIIEGKLTSVGGFDEYATNKLLTMQQENWVEEYPPMKIERSMTAVVGTDDRDHVIVIGGLCGGGLTTAVELFQVKYNKWYELTDLPQSLEFPSAGVCGHLLHVIGKGNVGYSCSLNLHLMDQPILSPLSSQPFTLRWKPLPALRVTQSTVATLGGELLLIGGNERCETCCVTTQSIFQLVGRKWVQIHSMSDEREMCLAASLSADKIIIICGSKDPGFDPSPMPGGFRLPDSIEVATVLC